MQTLTKLIIKIRIIAYIYMNVLGESTKICLKKKYFPFDIFSSKPLYEEQLYYILFT